MTAAAPLVLYVDDERPNRIVFEQSLIGEFRVRTAETPSHALAILEEDEVAVLVTDIRMPEMTGDQLLRIVKGRWPSTVRMVITAYSDIEPILAAINEGLVARYLLKPWSRDELVQLLRWGVEAWSFGRESAALQRRLLETERLATLGSIAGAVVHDLNQPVAGLVINAERLVQLGEAAAPIRALLDGRPIHGDDREYVADLAGELVELARDLHASATHLRGLLAGLGQFLYPRGAVEAAPQPTDPLPIVRTAIAMCQDLVIRARGTIGYEGPPALPAVRMPATELTQVLVNLVANAGHALAARGEPGRRVTVIARAGADALELQVRDEGTGMPADVLARVGTPFFTTREGGTGLGLAQCHRLIGKAGGTFKLDSAEGVGTTVTLTIPRA